MQVISLNDYRKEGAAAVRPSPCDRPQVKDKSERHRMHRLWSEAETIVRFYEGQKQFHHVCTIASWKGYEPAQLAMKANAFVAAGEDGSGTSHLKIQNNLRAAIAQAIRTPAPTQTQIWWKKRQLKDRFLFEFILPEEARAAIAADEAFHRDNPARKTLKNKGGDQ